MAGENSDDYSQEHLSGILKRMKEREAEYGVLLKGKLGRNPQVTRCREACALIREFNTEEIQEVQNLTDKHHKNLFDAIAFAALKKICRVFGKLN